jgi:hypothetical protein
MIVLMTNNPAPVRRNGRVKCRQVRNLLAAAPDGQFVSCSPPTFGGRGSTAGPAFFDDFVLYIATISVQKLRDLLYREAAHEHVAQRGQVRIGPFPLGVRAGRFVLNRGVPRIDDRGPNDASRAFCSGCGGPLRKVAISMSVTRPPDDAFA